MVARFTVTLDGLAKRRLLVGYQLNSLKPFKTEIQKRKMKNIRGKKVVERQYQKHRAVK